MFVINKDNDLPEGWVSKGVGRKEGSCRIGCRVGSNGGRIDAEGIGR